jgi:ubiquinone/menaquinone biosynthesis C-methylase UbiE
LGWPVGTCSPLEDRGARHSPLRKVPIGRILLSAMSKMFDYDATDISRAYAAARTLTEERRRVWGGHLRRDLADSDVRTIIDLGCGVGRFSLLLREVFQARVYGIDPSQRMLATAIATPAAHLVTWLRASAEALPIAEARIDLVFLYLVYHHLRDPLAALRECIRVLSSSGHLLVINATVEILDSLRWLPFFPSARQIDSTRLPTRAKLSEVAGKAGLTLIRQSTVLYPAASSLSTYAEHVAARTFSTLQLVSDEEFSRGASEFRRYCMQEDRGQPVEEVIDTFLFRR